LIGAASTDQYTFTGREQDASGLMFLRNRYYSPMLASFVSPDPLDIGGDSTNFYSYALNDPLDAVDPLGLSPGGGGAAPSDSWSYDVKRQRWRGFVNDNPFVFGPSGSPLGANPDTTTDVVLRGFLGPFKRLPDNPNESPGPGWVKKGPNWFNPETGQSLHPDFQHNPPQGKHWDLQQRGKQKLRLRMLMDQLQWFLEGPDIWMDIETLPMTLP